LLNARANGQGLPFSVNISPTEYNAHEDNFDITQDADGVMYFANFAGILVFDESKWDKIPLASGMRALCVETASDGTIYAGGIGDFGKMTRSANGRTEFISLTDTSWKEPVGAVFEIIAHPTGIYFFTDRKIYILSNKKIETISLKETAVYAFSVDNRMFVFFKPELNSGGLKLFENNAFKSVYTDEYQVFMSAVGAVSAKTKGDIYVATQNQGLFLMNEKQTFTVFDNEFNSYLEKNVLTDISSNSENEFAFATEFGGIIIGNADGKLITQLDAETGLADNKVRAVYFDKQGALWAATASGISKIDLQMPLRFLDNRTSELNGKVKKIVFADKLLYIGTDKGLFYISDKKLFEVTNFPHGCNDLAATDNGVPAATLKGICHVSEQLVQKTDIEDFTLSILRSKTKKDTYFSGHSGFVRQFEFANLRLKSISTIKLTEGDVRYARKFVFE